jgi:hypothetical protein
MSMHQPSPRKATIVTLRSQLFVNCDVQPPLAQSPQEIWNIDMTDHEPKRRSRGDSPRGDFETAKTVATNSEEERVAANRRKTKILQAARLEKLANETAPSKPQAEDIE